MELLGLGGSLVELLGNGWKEVYPSGNRVDEARNDEGRIHEWWSGPEDKWAGKIAAGAA